MSTSARPARPELRHDTEAEPKTGAVSLPIEGEQSSELELRRTLNAIRQTIVVLSPDGAPLYANRYVLEYIGFTMEEILSGDYRLHFVHPDDVAGLKEERSEGPNTGSSRALPTDGRCPSRSSSRST